MIDLGQHAQFIIAAYAGVFLGLAALIGWVVADSRRIKARLSELGDKRG
jgi:heme exporter protein CcmD